VALPGPAPRKKLQISAEGLIKFAQDQIEQETLNNMLATGKRRELSSFEKGRIILKFMDMKRQPLKNRHFYGQFFRQQDKAEKIQALENVSRQIHRVVAGGVDDGTADVTYDQAQLTKTSVPAALTL
jgi:hypothetical protein